MNSSSRTTKDDRFAFGKNWASYANLVSESRIEASVANLQRLIGGKLDGKRFLDVGCGSGLHALAALRLGAREVIAIDIDADSVETTRRVLQAHAARQPWRVVEMSAFDVTPQELGTFDVVYSWGVLHHTGDMHRALGQVARMTSPGGQFVFALYRRTRFCWFWKFEKRWYAGASPRAQAMARAVYLFLRRVAHLPRRTSFASEVAKYGTRGMELYHDMHDWLGGWPYESISPAELENVMRALHMHRIRWVVYPTIPLGLLGSGCDEYVYSPDERTSSLG